MKLNKLSSQHNTDTGLAILLIIFCLQLVQNQTKAIILLGLFTTIILMTKPSLLKPFAYIWFGLAKVLGLVMPKIILSMLYITFVIPYGFITGLFRSDLFKLKAYKSNTNRYFETPQKGYSNTSFNTPF